MANLSPRTVEQVSKWRKKQHFVDSEVRIYRGKPLAINKVPRAHWGEIADFLEKYADSGERPDAIC